MVDRRRQDAITRELLAQFDVRIDPATPVGDLSIGEQQLVEIVKALRHRPRVLILDEPTAALGVAQSGLVLGYIAQAARRQGIGVIFITHNPHHAYLVGDHFIVLARGEVELDTPRSQLTLENLMFHMAGGRELGALEHEIRGAGAPAPT
jgi:simple sugar transport system ATP-binding protein